MLNLGELRFCSGKDAANHVLDPEAANEDEGVTVPVTTLDQYADHQPVLMKIDVEGYEPAAFAGATKLLAAPSLRAIIAEVNDCGKRYGFTESDLLNPLLDAGFKPHQYSPFERELIPVEKLSGTSANTVFIRDLDWAIERVKNADAVNVLGSRL